MPGSHTTCGPPGGLTAILTTFGLTRGRINSGSAAMWRAGSITGPGHQKGLPARRYTSLESELPTTLSPPPTSIGNLTTKAS